MRKSLHLMLIMVLMAGSMGLVKADRVVTKDQQQIRGQIMTQNDKSMTIKTVYGTLVIPKDKIQTHQQELYEIKKSNGEVIKAKVEGLKNGRWHLETEQGESLRLAESEVDDISQIVPLTREELIKLSNKHREAIDLLMAKDYEKSIKLYREILEIRPEDNTAMYNIACAYSLQGDKAQAVKYLRKSVEAGFVSFPHIEQDKDLDNIRDHPDYIALMQDKQKYLDIANKKRVTQINDALESRGVNPDDYKQFYDKDRNFLFMHNKSEEEFEQIRTALDDFAEYQWKTLLVNKPRDPLYIVLLTEEDTPKVFPRNVGGQYRPAVNTLFVGDLPTWQLLKTSVLIHEFTHALHFADMRARQLRGMHPIWVIEGLATLYENSKREGHDVTPQDSQRLVVLVNAIRRNRAIGFERFFKLEHAQYMQNAAITYAQSRYIMMYLYDIGKLAEFYEALSAPENWEKDKTGKQALELVLGKPLNEIQTDWVRWLSKQKAPPTPDFGWQLDVKEEAVFIVNLTKKGPAAEAKLKKGDKIVSINGMPITDQNSLVRSIIGKDVGTAINIEIERDGKASSHVLTLGARKIPDPKKQSKPGYLGIAVEEVDGNIQIREVASKSPAEKAKLKVGFKVLKVDGKDIKSVQAFIEVSRKFRSGKRIKVLVEKDDGVKKEYRIKLR